MNDIEILKDFIGYLKEVAAGSEEPIGVSVNKYEIKAIEVLLNELDKKDKIINEMAKWIEKHTGYAIDETLYKESKEYIIDYFTKKVSE